MSFIYVCKHTIKIRVTKTIGTKILFIKFAAVKTTIKHIALFFSVLFTCIYAKAQDPIEAELARYEMVCSMCLDLKSRTHNGEEVSREEATSVLNVFVSLNGKLKARKQDMTPAQRHRFESIGEWFATGRRPMHAYPVPDMVHLPFEHNLFTIVTDTLKIPNPAKGEIKHFPPALMAKPELNAFVIIEMSLPDYSYGLRIGLQRGSWGGYMALRTNFRSDNSDYTCTSDGKLPSGGKLWAGNGQQVCNNGYFAGALYKAAPWISIYAGGGYGTKSLLWEDADGGWAKVSDCSYKGAAAEAGAILSWKKFAFSAGISTISFKTASLCCGIGVLF